jgi:toluene monooxygenase system ferredoxin subunit
VSQVELTWVEVGTLDDLWEGEMAGFEVEGAEVLLVHLTGGEICAYQGICPHQENLLADGDLEGTVITCAAHQWQFDARTGAGVNPTGAQLYCYDVKVEDEVIYVGVPAGAERRHNRFKV